MVYATVQASSLELIVRAYDIRGKYGTDLLPCHAAQLGRIIRKYCNKDDIIVVGRDHRSTSQTLEEAMTPNLGNVMILGIVTSPMFYYSAAKYDCAFGIMITASHNDSNDNGFKIVGRCGYPLDGTDIKELLRGRYAALTSVPTRIQRYTEYLQVLAASLPRQMSKIRWSAENPALQDAISDLRLSSSSDYDIGFVFDSDGDRVALTDGLGNLIESDKLMFALVLDQKPADGDWMIDHQFCDPLRNMGGKLSRPGHSIIRRSLAHREISLAGEVSGHFYFAEVGCDDGLYTAIRFLDAIARQGLIDSPMALFENTPSYYATPLMRTVVNGDVRIAINAAVDHILISSPEAQVTERCDSIVITLAEGSIMIRQSGTENRMVSRVEGIDQKALGHMRIIYSTAINRCKMVCNAENSQISCT